MQGGERRFRPGVQCNRDQFSSPKQHTSAPEITAPPHKTPHLQRRRHQPVDQPVQVLRHAARRAAAKAARGVVHRQHQHRGRVDGAAGRVAVQGVAAQQGADGRACGLLDHHGR
jgi:hypothetical protein